MVKMVNSMALEIMIDKTAPRMPNAHVSGTVTQTQAIAERQEQMKIDLGDRIARSPISITCPGKPNNAATAAHGTRYAYSMNLPPYKS